MGYNNNNDNNNVRCIMIREEIKMPRAKRAEVKFDNGAASAWYTGTEIPVMKTCWCSDPKKLTADLKERGWAVTNEDLFTSEEQKSGRQPKYTAEYCEDIVRQFVEETGYISNTKYSLWAKMKASTGTPVPGHRT